MGTLLLLASPTTIMSGSNTSRILKGNREKWDPTKKRFRNGAWTMLSLV